MRTFATVAPLVIAAGAFAAVPDYPTLEVLARGSESSSLNLPAGTAPYDAGVDSFESVVSAYIHLTGATGPGIAMDGVSLYEAPIGATMGRVSSAGLGGSIVFGLELEDGTGSYVVYDTDAMTATPVLSGGGKEDLLDLTFLNSPPDVSLSGGFSFRANTSDGVQRLMRWADGGLTELATSEEGDIGALTRFTATNDDGAVACRILLAAGGREVRRYDAAGEFVVIAQESAVDGGSEFSSIGPAVRLSEDGDVVFISNLTNGQRGIFAGDGTTTREIANTADGGVSAITSGSGAARASSCRACSWPSTARTRTVTTRSS